MSFRRVIAGHRNRCSIVSNTCAGSFSSVDRHFYKLAAYTRDCLVSVLSVVGESSIEVFEMCIVSKAKTTVCRVARFLSLLLMAGTTCIYASNTVADETMVVRHYDRGYSPLLRVYLTDVLRLVLDKTVSEYGPYQLQFYSRHLSTNRSKLETERGQLIDLLFSSNWRGNFVNPDKVIALDYPVFDGVLGLRNLIIREQDQEKFSSINGLRDLQALMAGQGANWEDVEVLEANGLRVVQSQLFDSLFPMLVKSRFDYLPLGILEARTALQTKGAQHPELVIQKDIAIFYPLPFYLYVNRNRPLLAERFAKGLEIAQYDGSLERLFQQHFSYVQPELYSSTKKIIVLNSPLLTREKNEEVIERFLNKYQPHTYFMP